MEMIEIEKCNVGDLIQFLDSGNKVSETIGLVLNVGVTNSSYQSKLLNTAVKHLWTLTKTRSHVLICLSEHTSQTFYFPKGWKVKLVSKKHEN